MKFKLFANGVDISLTLTLPLWGMLIVVYVNREYPEKAWASWLVVPIMLRVAYLAWQTVCKTTKALHAASAAGEKLWQ